MENKTTELITLELTKDELKIISDCFYHASLDGWGNSRGESFHALYRKLNNL